MKKSTELKFAGLEMVDGKMCEKYVGKNEVFYLEIEVPKVETKYKR